MASPRATGKLQHRSMILGPKTLLSLLEWVENGAFIHLEISFPY